MSKRWMMVAGALLLLCAAPPAVMAAAESMVTVTLGSQAPRGADYRGARADGGEAASRQPAHGRVEEDQY